MSVDESSAEAGGRNFAVTGVAGFVAPRHLRAIRDTGSRLIAAVDPHDAVGVLDQYGLNVRFFTEIERFDRHLEKLRRRSEEERVHYVSVCSPNYLHDAHCRLALRLDADAICEKPLVINPWNLDLLEELEEETGHRVYPVLQLRYHPKLLELRAQKGDSGRVEKAEVEVTYITARGAWYGVSWKGVDEKSGGIAANIGVHFFDMLIWLFGPVQRCEVHLRDRFRMSGHLELERARVKWFLSVDAADLAFEVQPGRKSTYRSIRVDGEEVEFTEGFTDLHTEVYRAVLGGSGLRLSEARPAIELVYQIRTTELSEPGHFVHAMLPR
jgi:UDP-N-acetyl-2-amino-2-deoxyglucuronate dehydrogenase